MEVMSQEHFAKEMQKIIDRFRYEDNDVERMHTDINELICELLISLGYRKGVEIFLEKDI